MLQGKHIPLLIGYTLHRAIASSPAGLVLAGSLLGSENLFKIEVIK